MRRCPTFYWHARILFWSLNQCVESEIRNAAKSFKKEAFNVLILEGSKRVKREIVSGNPGCVEWIRPVVVHLFDHNDLTDS